MLIHPDDAAFSLTPTGKACEENDTALLFRNGELLLRRDGERLLLPQWTDVHDYATGDPLQICTLDGRTYYAGRFASVPEDGALEACSARIFRTFEPRLDGYLITVAQHMLRWYEQHRYCGACGKPLRPSDRERALCCDGCGLTVYPTIMPAISVAITDGDRILLALGKNPVFRHYALVAGYVEAGETLEQTVRREIAEEVGLRVKNVRYIASQPWGVSQALMIGFAAQLDGDNRVTLQQSELDDARWFTRDELVRDASPAGISFELIERFRRGTL